MCWGSARHFQLQQQRSAGTYAPERASAGQLRGPEVCGCCRALPGGLTGQARAESQSPPAARAVLLVEHQACTRLLSTMLHAAQHSATRHR